MPVRPIEGWEPLFEGLRKLRTSWPARGWSWDTRLACVSSSFAAELETKARAAAAEALPTVWTGSTLTKATSALREVAERSGGLRSGQLLLSGRPFGRIVPFGLWWPWGDGITISLRVGLWGVDMNDEPYPDFRDIFGVSV
jgi:hypothetical protein